MKAPRMRILLLFVLCHLVPAPSAKGIFLWFEDFETDGLDTRYTITGGGEYYSDANNYLTRVRDLNGFFPGGATPLLDIGGESGSEYTWITGQWFFAAENLDGDGTRIFEWRNINTDPHFNVVFDADFGAGSNGANPPYDAHNFIAVLYSTDGGVNFIPGLVFRFDGRAGASENRQLAQMLNIAPSGKNGINTLEDLGNQLATGAIVPGGDPGGDPFAYIAPDRGQAASGPPLRTQMEKFLFRLPEVRSITLRLVFNMQGANAEIAFDNLTIHGTPRVDNHPPSVVNVFAPAPINEEGSFGFSEDSFDEGFRDPDPPDTLQEIRILSLPTSGTLYQGLAEIDRIPTVISRAEFENLIYVPAPDSGGTTDSFYWHASDGEKYAAFAASYLIPIEGTNDPPVAGADTVERLPGASLQIPLVTLLANDDDPGDQLPDLPLTITQVNYTGAHGASLTLQGDSILYESNGYTGDDHFTYRVIDARGALSAPVTVTIQVVDEGALRLQPSLEIVIADLPSGSASITARGIAGRGYRVQAADPEAGAWFDLPGGAVVADPDGRVLFIDPGPLPPARIYRVVHP